MRRSHTSLLMLSMLAATAGGAATGDNAVVITAGKRDADEMRVPRQVAGPRRSRGTVANKKRRSRRRGG